MKQLYQSANQAYKLFFTYQPQLIIYLENKPRFYKVKTLNQLKFFIIKSIKQKRIKKLVILEDYLKYQKMSEDRQFAEKLQDLFQQKVNVQSQQVPISIPSYTRKDTLTNENNKSLALQNMNSLALFPRLSIEKGIPINPNMLSQDMYNIKESSSISNQQNSSIDQTQQRKNQQKFQMMRQPIIMQDQQEWLVQQLDLPKNVNKIRFPQQNTKNVLRNFGNAQNQYALYNQDAKNIVQNQISDPQIFYQWIRQLKLENFDGFKAVWIQNPNNSKLFLRVYKKLCWKFYTETAVPYVLTSRMRDTKTKISHLKYIYRFLQGLRNPQDFSYFKKVEK